MKRPAISPCGLLAALLCGALTGCRTKPPVVRHFVSMPPEYAAGLSSVERAKWFKQSRKQLPPRRELTATGHLILPAFASALGTRLSGMEVLHAPGSTSSRQGGLAVKAGDDTPPVFLRYEPGHYFNATPAIPASSSWRFDPARHAALATTAAGRSTIECRWTGTTWQVRSAR